MERSFLDALSAPLACAELTFRLVEERWHGRLESLDLELPAAHGAHCRAGSAVLSALGRLPGASPQPALAYALLAVTHLVERTDPRLVLGPEDTVDVWLRTVDDEALCLGRYDGEEWTDES